MRRIDLQVVNGGVERERRRRGLPTCASNGMRQCPAMAPRRLKTSVPVTQFFSPHLRVHTPSCPVSCGGAEQGSNRTDCSARSARQISGQATEWYVTGPLLPRGPSADDLKSVPTAKWLPSRSCLKSPTRRSSMGAKAAPTAWRSVPGRHYCGRCHALTKVAARGPYPFSDGS